LGFVAKRLGRVPIPGAHFEIGGWSLTAEQGAGRRNRIGTVLAQSLPSSDEDPGDDDE
jgi:CBS domain containing-hemolysin-like protein